MKTNTLFKESKRLTEEEVLRLMDIIRLDCIKRPNGKINWDIVSRLFNAHIQYGDCNYIGRERLRNACAKYLESYLKTAGVDFIKTQPKRKMTDEEIINFIGLSRELFNILAQEIKRSSSKTSEQPEIKVR